MADVSIEFCGEWYEPTDDDVFTIGREGDLEIDDNPYLHRKFLQMPATTASGGWPTWAP